MRPIATGITRSVVCVSVCLLVILMHLCKNNWTDRDVVWGLTHVSPRNHVLDGVEIGRIHSQPQEMISGRCGLLQNYLEHVFELAYRWPKTRNIVTVDKLHGILQSFSYSPILSAVLLSKPSPRDHIIHNLWLSLIWHAWSRKISGLVPLFHCQINLSRY